MEVTKGDNMKGIDTRELGRTRVWEDLGQSPRKTGHYFLENPTGKVYKYTGEGKGDPREWGKEPQNWKVITKLDRYG